MQSSKHESSLFMRMVRFLKGNKFKELLVTISIGKLIYVRGHQFH